MANREDLVYQAKLAEQAERYDGKTELGAGVIRKLRCLKPWLIFLLFKGGNRGPETSIVKPLNYEAKLELVCVWTN